MVAGETKLASLVLFGHLNNFAPVFCLMCKISKHSISRSLRICGPASVTLIKRKIPQLRPCFNCLIFGIDRTMILVLQNKDFSILTNLPLLTVLNHVCFSVESRFSIGNQYITAIIQCNYFMTDAICKSDIFD